MKGQSVLFSNAATGGRDDWRTPIALFAALNKEFNFSIDGAADVSNALLPVWYGPGGRTGIWPPFERVFCNPPYSQIREFVTKAAAARIHGCLSVLLIPARVDTGWFHDYIYKIPDVEVRFLRGRVKFQHPDGREATSAPFPSMVVVFRP